jgi:hypothetical protein
MDGRDGGRLMSIGDHTTHAELAAELRASIERLRTDIESRSDPMLEEVAHALELILGLTTHAHEHAVTNSDRLAELERE